MGSNSFLPIRIIVFCLESLPFLLELQFRLPVLLPVDRPSPIAGAVLARLLADRPHLQLARIRGLRSLPLEAHGRAAGRI
jgi:hypothetical protein